MLNDNQILDNWNVFIQNIEDYITEPRKKQLIDFYKQYEDRLIIYPASHKKEYHNSFPGGYIDHVNRVVRCALKLYKVWQGEGVDITTFTKEELVFSAINHDLGKIGDQNHAAYIPQTDKWRQEKLGENWMFNDKLAFASVPDKSLYLLQIHGIRYTFNEMLAIQTHDGLYDEANKKYFMSFSSETKPRTSLPYILHHADMMAARIEWELEWLPEFKKRHSQIEKPKNQKQKNFELKAKATPSSKGLSDLLTEI